MTTCENLCTAAKCQELENRIVILEDLINDLTNRIDILENQPEINYDSLQNLLDEHINKKTSEAHEWDIKLDGYFDYDVSYDDMALELSFLNTNNNYLGDAISAYTNALPFVLDSDFQLHLNDVIPNAHQYEPTIVFEVTHQNDGSDLMTLKLDETQTEAYLNTEPLELNINTDSSNDVIEYDFEIKLGNKTANSTITIELSSIQNETEITNLVEEYFTDIDFYFRIDDRPNNDWNFYLQIGDRSREAILDLPRFSSGGGSGGTEPSGEEETEQQPKNLSVHGNYDEENNNLNISVSINGKSDSVSINLDNLGMETLDKIWAVLGGNAWNYNSNNKTVSLNLQPETEIKTTGLAQYSTNTDTGKNINVANLIELITSLHSVDYFRSGHHRLPATAFNSLLNTSEGNQQLKIYDSLSFQEWIIKNIDALVGEFPLKLKYKTSDGEQEVSLENTSEAIAEIAGLLLSLAEDSSNNLNATIKAMIEARNAANAATVAVDYASANADYLGYKGREKTREVNVTFTPGKETMKEVLTPSKQKIIGWEMQGEETLLELVKRILMGAEIIKAAMYIPWQPGDNLTGDVIKEKQAEQTEIENTKWQDFINRVNTPTGKYKTNKPNAHIKDISVDKQ